MTDEVREEREVRDRDEPVEMRSTDETRDPESRRMSDADPMAGEAVREDDPARTDVRMHDDKRSRDDMTGTRAGMASTGTRSERTKQMEMWPDMGDLRQRFDTIQSDFIDDPRSAVNNAEKLISEVIDRITRSMHDRVTSMHGDMDKNADTEQLRQTMRGYRDLVDWMEQRRAA